MEYIIAGLIILWAMTVVLVSLEISSKNQENKEKDSIIEKLLQEQSVIKGNLLQAGNVERSLRYRLKTATESLTKYKENQTNEIVALNKNELKKHLRFILPDGNIAINVRVKYIKDRNTIKAVVRKKVKGKFTDVEVEPVFVIPKPIYKEKEAESI